MVCGGEPDDEQAMECCRKDAAAHCNMPEKKEDCCKPDRTGKNPAALEIAAGSPTKQRIENSLAPEIPSIVDVLHRPNTATLIPLARGFPERLSREPRILPLLI